MCKLIQYEIHYKGKQQQKAQCIICCYLSALSANGNEKVGKQLHGRSGEPVKRGNDAKAR